MINRAIFATILAACGFVVSPIYAQEAGLQNSGQVQDGASLQPGGAPTGPAPTESLNSLQPANPGLQSTGQSAQSSGDAQTNLQQVGGQEALELFVAGEDNNSAGSSDAPAQEEGKGWLWAAFILSVLVLIAAAAMLVRARRTAQAPMMKTEEATYSDAPLAGETEEEAATVAPKRAATKTKRKTKSKRKNKR